MFLVALCYDTSTTQSLKWQHTHRTYNLSSPIHTHTRIDQQGLLLRSRICLLSILYKYVTARPLWSKHGDNHMELVGAKLAAVLNVSITLTWPIFSPLYSLAGSHSFSCLLSLEMEALMRRLAITKDRGT